jgi:hypothetical protein
VPPGPNEQSNDGAGRGEHGEDAHGAPSGLGPLGGSLGSVRLADLTRLSIRQRMGNDLSPRTATLRRSLPARTNHPPPTGCGTDHTVHSTYPRSRFG